MWGEVPGSRKQPIDGDSLGMIASCGKNFGSILMGVLRDQGLIDFGEKVATYWPEFGQNDKEDITISDVLRHEGRLHKLDKAISLQDFQTEQIKQNSIG